MQTLRRLTQASSVKLGPSSSVELGVGDAEAARGGSGLRNTPSSSVMMPFISQSTCVPGNAQFSIHFYKLFVVSGFRFLWDRIYS